MAFAAYLLENATFVLSGVQFFQNNNKKMTDAWQMPLELIES